MFLLGVDSSSGRTVVLSGGFGTPFKAYLGTTGIEPLRNDVQLYAFFVEGTGEVPDAPVRLVTDPAEDSAETMEFSFTHEQHTLPLRYALRVTENDIGVLPRRHGVMARFRNGKTDELGAGRSLCVACFAKARRWAKQLGWIHLQRFIPLQQPCRGRDRLRD